MQKLFLSFILILFVFFGCKPPQQVQREEPPVQQPTEKKIAGPEIVIKVGDLNLASYSKKMESGDVQKLAAFLKRDTIDIFAVQGITRYPDLPSRIDFVQELARRADLRQSFGETINLSGRQNGNAVFSTYPIRSSENTPYPETRSTKMESALQSLIDCGVREVVIVSTLVPDNTTNGDQSTAVNILGTFNNLYINKPIIIAGNLPRSGAVRSIAAYNDVEPIPQPTAPRIWFSSNNSLVQLGVKVENTPFGPVTVARFGIFRQQNP